MQQCNQCNTDAENVTLDNDCEMGSPAQDGPGVTNQDFVLYITAEQSACPESQGLAQIVAFALSCQTESVQDRPVAGVVNFCPDGVQNRNADFAFAVTKHEILHALGISQNLFPLWRDADNMPRTPRQDNGLPATASARSVPKTQAPVGTCPHCNIVSLCIFFKPVQRRSRK